MYNPKVFWYHTGAPDHNSEAEMLIYLEAAWMNMSEI